MVTSRTLIALLIVLAVAVTAQAADLHSSFMLGHDGGPSGQINVAVSDFARNFPLGARFSLGYTSVDPGSPLDARRIFINDATNGTPEESGRYWAFSFDLVYALSSLGNQQIYLYGGPRHARFRGVSVRPVCC